MTFDDSELQELRPFFLGVLATLAYLDLIPRLWPRSDECAYINKAVYVRFTLSQ